MLIASKAMIALAGLFVLGGNTQEQTSHWANQVITKLDRAVTFDARALAPHLYGVTGLAFRIGEDGRATDIRLVRTSGNDWLDRRAAGKLRMIGRLPDAPDTVEGRTILALIEQGRRRQHGTATVEKARPKALAALRAEAQRLAALDGKAPVIVSLS